MITIQSLNTKIAEFETLETAAQHFNPSPFAQGLQDFTFIDTDTNTIIPWTRIAEAQQKLETAKTNWAKQVIETFFSEEFSNVTIPE